MSECKCWRQNIFLASAGGRSVLLSVLTLEVTQRSCAKDLIIWVCAQHNFSGQGPWPWHCESLNQGVNPFCFSSGVGKIKNKKHVVTPSESPRTWSMCAPLSVWMQSPAAWLWLRKSTLDMKASQEAPVEKNPSQ